MVKSVVCFDVGSETLKMVEFSWDKQNLQLVNFGVVDLGKIEPDAPLETLNTKIAQAIRRILNEKGIKTRTVSISISGQSVFTRFVKLPAVEEAKISQIIKYEAQQQVPFPIEEVEWDHQVIGSISGEEIDIVLIAVKNEIVNGLLDAIAKVKLEVDVIDVSSLALYNCVKYTEDVPTECVALVDFGAKTTSLIIFEGDNLWSRSIPIGGESFTTAISREMNIDQETAEKLKRISWVNVSSPTGIEKEMGEDVIRASQVVTNMMSRLLAEIRRSIGFYRTQSRGSAVSKIVVSGGGAYLKQLNIFLAEKLKVDIDILQPLKKINIAPSVNREEINRVSHLLGDVIGLGLRKAQRAKLRINLLPKVVTYQKELSKKKAFLLGAAAFLVGIILILVMNAQTDVTSAKGELEIYNSEYETRRKHKDKIQKIQREIRAVNDKVSTIEKIQKARLYWIKFIETLKKKKPKYAWFTEFRLLGSVTADTTTSRFEPSRAGTFRGMGSMPGGMGSMPGRSFRGPTTGRGTEGDGPVIVLSGYLKITNPTAEVLKDVARQFDDLKRTLEGKEDEELLRQKSDELKKAELPKRPNSKELREIYDEISSQKKEILGLIDNYLKGKEIDLDKVYVNKDLDQRIQNTEAKTEEEPTRAQLKEHKKLLDELILQFAEYIHYDFFAEIYPPDKLQPFEFLPNLARFEFQARLKKKIEY